jgi:phosphoribosylamine-glycine ligase
MGADMVEEKARGTEFSEKAIEDLKKISPAGTARVHSRMRILRRD